MSMTQTATRKPVRPYPDHLGAALARYRRYLATGTAERLEREWSPAFRNMPRLFVEREVARRLRLPGNQRFVLSPLPIEPDRR